MSQMKEKWKNSSGLMLCKMVNLRNYNWVIIGGPPPRAHLPTLSFGANILELEKNSFSYRIPTVFLLFEPIVRTFWNFSARFRRKFGPSGKYFQFNVALKNVVEIHYPNLYPRP